MPHNENGGLPSSQDSEHHGDASPTTTLRTHQPIDELEFQALGTDNPTVSKASSDPVEKSDIDVLIVDWEGPDDPQNPKNWSFKRKWAATAIVSSFTFISPVSSSMVAPATAQLAAGFGLTNSVVMAMSTSIFILAFAFGPLFFGPMSEIYGRSRVLQLANLWYLVWNLGCGFAQNETQLLAFRFLAGLGGSAPLAIGGGVLGDCWKPEERGQAAALYSLAPFLGPVIGPITGAWIAEYSTWRWVFWSTSIADGVVQILGMLFLQESNICPLLLERKAKKIRQAMDEEKVSHREVRTVFEAQGRTWQAILTKALVRPFVMFYHEPILQLLGVYMAYLYGMLYLVLTTIPTMFEGAYNEPVGTAGLHYLALGIGLTGASQLNARSLDKVYVYLTKKYGGVGRPEYRLPAMFPGTILLPIGYLILGWTVEAHAPWIAPDIGIALASAGTILNFQCIQTYIIDTFTLHAASALAAVSFLRSICGFGFPLFAPAMYEALGFGMGDTILTIAAIVIGCPAPWIFWHYGERIRKASRYGR
ncbi:MFS polyamine transporter [Melanogaster broomeanus]|nr:MFS polyamine transporter [Melanogaster broomeanus]